VLVVPDTFTEYTHPEVGTAAVRVLEAANVRVDVADARPSGRPAYSLGFLDRARERARANVDALAPAIENGWTPVFVEPADAVMVQDEYRDLVDGPSVDRVADATRGLMEYLDRERVDERLDFAAPEESLVYHGHCNQKAVGTDHHAVGVLRRAGYPVAPVDSTCCGMAGASATKPNTTTLAGHRRRPRRGREGERRRRRGRPGTSCRTQLGDRADAGDPDHPIERVAVALGQSSGQ